MAGKAKERGRGVRTRILSIVVSLALSFFLWLALSGQDTSTTELSVPLELVNMPGNLAVKSELPTSVTFQVLANTAQLRFLSDRKLHVWINAASTREGYNAFPVDSNSLDLPRGVQVRRVSPPVIEFEAVKTANKTLPLKPTVSGTVNPAYRVKALIIEPDQVTVQGPKEILDSLTELSTNPIPLEGLTRDTNLTVTPALTPELDPSLIITPREIKVSISVEERTLEETFADLPVELDFKNGGGRADDLLVEPTRAEITLSWPASRARAVTAGDIRIRVFVDMERLRAEKSLSLPVVAVPPGGTTVTAISPVNVTVSLPPSAGGPENSKGVPETEAPAASQPSPPTKGTNPSEQPGT